MIVLFCSICLGDKLGDTSATSSTSRPATHAVQHTPRSAGDELLSGPWSRRVDVVEACVAALAAVASTRRGSHRFFGPTRAVVRVTRVRWDSCKLSALRTLKTCGYCPLTGAHLTFAKALRSATTEVEDEPQLSRHPSLLCSRTALRKPRCISLRNRKQQHKSSL